MPFLALTLHDCLVYLHFDCLSNWLAHSLTHSCCPPLFSPHAFEALHPKCAAPLKHGNQLCQFSSQLTNADYLTNSNYESFDSSRSLLNAFERPASKALTSALRHSSAMTFHITSCSCQILPAHGKGGYRWLQICQGRGVFTRKTSMRPRPVEWVRRQVMSC